MWPFKSKAKREQNARVLTEDGRDVDEAMNADTGYMDAKKYSQSWYLVPRWLVYDEATDCNMQLISERNAIPIPLGLIFCIDKEEEVNKLTDLKTISKEKYREIKTEVEENATKSRWMMNAITIAGLGMACFILVVAAITLFQSGRLHLPALPGLGG